MDYRTTDDALDRLVAENQHLRAALKQAGLLFERIADGEYARRHGGPDPSDLEGLDEALADAIETALQGSRTIAEAMGLAAPRGEEG